MKWLNEVMHQVVRKSAALRMNRNEMSELLYVEDLSGAGVDAAEKEKALQEFSSRALKGFRILR
jgi:hypothetical protein